MIGSIRKQRKKRIKGGEQMSDKIGTDILGYGCDNPKLAIKKKRELEQIKKERMEKEKPEEKEKDEEKKLPKLSTPGDIPPKAVAGQADYEKMVNVSEHKRGKPKKKGKEAVEVI
jgi:hypothetical protein